MTIKMLSMPLAQLEQSVQAEIDDNPALEILPDSNVLAGEEEEQTKPEEETSAADYGEEESRGERQSALDEALERMASDDEPGLTARGGGYAGSDRGEYGDRIFGSHKSFYDSLREQVAETELTDVQRRIMDYLIGSLDDDGLLRRNANDIVDELAVYHNTMVTERDVLDTIAILKGFDPAGLGASSLRECLLLQIDRRPPSALKNTMRDIVSLCYDDFTQKHHDKIAATLGVDIGAVERAIAEIQRLNPKPGSALCESDGSEEQTVTPDFIVETGEDGTVTFYINKGRVPELHVSPAFSSLLQGYKANGGSMNRQDKEALLYAKQRVDRARGYIEAIRQRQSTMYKTMKTIIDIQHDFFVSGDEADIKPMVLKDLSVRTGLDISTVSRICAGKYAQTRWGIFRLRHFFSEGIRGGNGETIATRRLKVELKDIIDNEDKDNPLSDDALRAEMKKRGYDIARRTIAKYREQAGIPVSRLRKR